ncbi:MAG: PQQ-dependent sugar dehydrogenase [Deltaproteobacteria bacterium]|nr:MAG: PQQ-dependent sugar dehydrogenase [Deltaproteobacteria bacterium]
MHRLIPVLTLMACLDESGTSDPVLSDRVSTESDVTDTPPSLEREVWLTGIGRPWDIAFLPDTTMLVTERTGRVRAVDLDTAETWVLLEPPADLAATGQSGMLGVAVDPDFETNGFIYTYMSSSRDSTVDNRIRRWVLDEGVSTLTEDTDILTGISRNPSSGAHSGGRIRFGPGGNLWVTTGDIHSATVPQDTSVLGGKVLRITRDGEPAPGNPDLGPSSRPEIAFVGVRNPQGIAFRPGTGEPFLCEHGPSSLDEVTQIVIGGNGGWDPNDGSGNYTGYTGALMTDPSIDGAVEPTYEHVPSQGMSDCDFLVGSHWGGWRGRLVVGLLSGLRAMVLSIDAQGTGLTEDPEPILAHGSRLRALAQGPDGALYVALDADPGTIWRVTAE